MKTLEILDGDLIFENGDFKIIEGEKEIAQCIAISLGTNLKEWFLNEELGIDFSSVFGKSSQDLARAEVMRVLAQEERVNLIKNLEILDDRVNRKRTILFSVQLANGELLEDEVVISD